MGAPSDRTAICRRHTEIPEAEPRPGTSPAARRLSAAPTARLSRKTRPMKAPMRGRQPGHHTTPAFKRERAPRLPTPARLRWTSSSRPPGQPPRACICMGLRSSMPGRARRSQVVRSRRAAGWRSGAPIWANASAGSTMPSLRWFPRSGRPALLLANFRSSRGQRPRPAFVRPRYFGSGGGRGNPCASCRASIDRLCGHPRAARSTGKTVSRRLSFSHASCRRRTI